MTKFTVTLKSDLKHGTFYWVAKINANSEEEAITSAEHLFMAEMENTSDWEFNDFSVEEE